MKHGDLSNLTGLAIAFRCEDFLIKYKESSLADKVLNAVIGKAKRAEIDDRVLKAMEYLYRNTEYSVDLVVQNYKYTEDLKRVLQDLPFNRVILIDRPSQISSRLLVGDIAYYLDDNESRRSLVNSKFCMSLDEFWGMVRKGRRE